MNNIVKKIIAFENGEMEDSEFLEFFKELDKSGIRFSVKESYEAVYYSLED